MWHRWLMLSFLLSACEPSDTGDSGTDTGSDTDTDTPDTDPPPGIELFRLPPPAEAQGVYTASAAVCSNCHSTSVAASALRDAAGRPVAPHDLWRSSVMAHASRDPFFRTALAAEQAATPSQAEAIGRTCMTCHSPLAWAEGDLEGTPTVGPDVLHDPGPLGDLARDGAACLGCHLQEPPLGDPSTWSGGHPLNDQRRANGPHVGPLAGPMQNFANVTPVLGTHVLQAGLCASCHTLQTETLAADGTPTGHTLTEQAPYVEWRSSDFSTDRGRPEAATCQECHMPTVDVDGQPIETRIARNPNGGDFPRVYERTPVARHLLQGGNTLLLSVLQEHGELLGSPATAQELAASEASTRAWLKRAARVETSAVQQDGDRLTARVTVFNETGHKLPTGYPARRAWLHVQVLDASDTVVFESGATDASGRLVDGQGQVLPSERDLGAWLPHRTVLSAPDHVVVWHGVLGDAAGEPTTTLLRAASWLHDNRLLPRGFSPTEEDLPLVAPRGTQADPRFLPGGDAVDLDVPLAGTGPWRLEAHVRYQSWSPVFLDTLLGEPVDEAQALRALLGDRGIPVETLDPE